MQIKPVQFTNDPRGLPATGYAYHIGLPNEDPLNDDNKLTVKDGLDGATISNPFYVDSLGHFINTNGQRVNPWIDEEKCSKVILSPAGGELYREENEISDRVTSGNIQDSVVDAVFNNFIAAKAANLTDYDTIYIESDLAGWEDTVAGPVDGFYAHADGTTGMPSSGSRASFFDSIGNGWREDDSQRLGDDSVTTIKIEDSAVTTIKIDNDAVTTIKIDDDAVTSDKIADDAVGYDQLAVPTGYPSKITRINTLGAGTFTTDTETKAMKVTAVGGGGAGAGGASDRAGGGGGSGSKAITYILLPASSYSYFVGDGAAGSFSALPAASGEDTWFDSVSVCRGRQGAGAILWGGGTGGPISIGDIAANGFSGCSQGVDQDDLWGKTGGTGGGEGGGVIIVKNAIDNTGGGGAGGQGGTGVTAQIGGNGGSGYIIVEEFF